jgi:tRNA nucleotidyltransferase (CCA-adding enzyme)
MKNKFKDILNEVLEKVEPPKEDLKIIEDSLKDFLGKFEKKLKDLKIDAEIFVGGSFAKNTVIKKDKYDADIFVRFDKKYKEEISNLIGKILKKMKVENALIIHGSRDYFRIKVSPDFFIELIPVIRIKSPKEYENVTDLSYSHVKYINRKLKSKEILDEIRIAKAFCYANNCYGAESYINGFSGYALELLIYYYGTFLKFVKAMTKIKDKIVIDIEKHHKNKQAVLMNINSSKLSSPIILIDPTYKQRNSLAALSEETFEKFKEDCKRFLKNPNIKAFEIKKIDLEKIKLDAIKKKYEFILVESKTDKQVGDIAGTKLLKFYKHLISEIEKFFEIKNKGFNYNGKKSARYLFVVKNRKEILFKGPNTKDEKNIKKFKKKHKNIFVKFKKIYAKEKIKFNIGKFIELWKKKNKKKIKEMQITKLKIID